METAGKGGIGKGLINSNLSKRSLTPTHHEYRCHGFRGRIFSFSSYALVLFLALEDCATNSKIVYDIIFDIHESAT